MPTKKVETKKEVTPKAPVKKEKSDKYTRERIDADHVKINGKVIFE